VRGMGCHLHVGGWHAERVLLAGRAEAFRGGDLYLTLEPCIHQGRTPPCAPLVIAAGFRRAWIGLLDPDPRVAGGGVRALRRAGVEIPPADLPWVRAAAELNAPFLAWHAWGRPWVTLKAAISIDGRMAAADGSSQWISSAIARERVHRWRRSCDALLVGRGTLERDRCALTARPRGGASRVRDRLAKELADRDAVADERSWLLERAGWHQPARIVVDSHARCAGQPELLRHLRNSARAGGCWIVACSQKSADRARGPLEAAGAKVWAIPAEPTSGRVSLPALLARAGREAYLDLMVEGGGELASALIRQGLIDRYRLFLAPLLLGGERTWTGELGVASLTDAIGMRRVRARRCGPDVFVEALAPRAASLLERQVDLTTEALGHVHGDH